MHITPIIQMTSNCNMACKYCYVGSNKRIDDNGLTNKIFKSNYNTLLQFIDQLLDYNEYTPTRLIFHGGEPLLVNLSNWEMLLADLEKRSSDLKFSIQTNGTLFTNSHLKLFKKYHMEIGISLDGPAFLNDETRILKNGEGSFKYICKNIEKIKNYGMNCGVLVTINKRNSQHAKEIYNLFLNMEVPFTIRPIFQTQFSVPEDYLLSPEEYATFYCEIFDLWFEDNNSDTLLNQEFASMIAQFIKPIEGLVSCNFSKKCNEHFISFDFDGNLYPCNRLWGENEFYYGNITENSLKDILRNKTFENLSSRWENLSKTSCANCDIADYCYGGCPASGFYHHNNYLAKDYYCSAYRKIFHHVYNKIQSTL